MVEFQELPDSEPELEEQYVDENFEIQTRTKDETQIELEKEQATEDAINTEIDRENETPQELYKIWLNPLLSWMTFHFTDKRANEYGI